MQPLVMQEWLYVLPPCPEWRVPEQAQRSSSALPLSQVRAAPGSLARGSFLQGLQIPGGQTKPSVAGGRQGSASSSPPWAALKQRVHSPLALQLFPKVGGERQPAGLDFKPLSQ